MKVYSYLNILLSIFSFLSASYGQSTVEVNFGNTSLKEGEPLEMHIVMRGIEGRPEVVVPNLNDFSKGQSSMHRRTFSKDGKSILEQTFTQFFHPNSYGTIQVHPFSVMVNGNRFDVEEFTVQIGSSVTDSTVVAREELFEMEQNVKEGIFLAVRTSKRSVFLREGFGAYLALYVAKDITISMDFYDLNRQLQDILKVLKPSGCWEENTWLEEVQSREVELNGRAYTEYRIYQSVFFPFIEKDVRFPSVELTMHMADGKQIYQAFRSEPTVVRVNALPEHPLKNVVSVGNFSLTEKASKTELITGESFIYSFVVSGTGNIAAINAPTLPQVASFDFYPPEVVPTINKSLTTVSGQKAFDYTIVGKKSGDYTLQPYFQWVYFNTTRARYDTLKSNITVNIRGGLMAPSGGTVEVNSMYSNIDQLSTLDSYWNYRDLVRNIMNVVVFLMLCVCVWVFYKR